jgi:hypothetical protein
MTEHPLTDDIIRYVKKLGCPDLGTWIYTENDLRAAADWELEWVIKWLRKNLDERYIDDGDILAPGIDVESVVIDLKQAMRPTQDNK